jgi:hypothetical protein
MERFSIAGFRIQFRDVDVGTRDTVSIFLNPHSNLVLFRAVLVDKTLDVNESSNRAASHLEAGISSLSTDMNNQGSPEIPSNISNLVFPEEYGNMTKKEPDQIHQNLSAPSLNDAIGSSLLIGHSKNTYQTSLQGEIELPHDDFIQAIIDQRNADVLEAGLNTRLQLEMPSHGLSLLTSSAFIPSGSGPLSALSAILEQGSQVSSMRCWMRSVFCQLTACERAPQS